MESLHFKLSVARRKLSGQHLYNKNESIKSKSYNKFLKRIIVIKYKALYYICVCFIDNL